MTSDQFSALSDSLFSASIIIYALAALAFWSYPILILIGIGAWRTPTVERWRSAHDVASLRAIT